MAEAATPKPQWALLGVIGLVLGALGGAAVLVGPTAVDCQQQSAGFGECLKQGMAERGIIPAADSDDGSIEVAAANPAQAVVEPQDTLETSTPAPGTAEPADTAETISKLIFDVRVEPDGSTLVIGKGAPENGEVQVFANGELLGQTKAEKGGDWVFLPDAPLATGGVEITAGTVDGAEIAGKSLVVIVNEDRESEPLVVASAPGEASQIIQGATASSSVEQSVGPAPQMDVAESPAPTEQSTDVEKSSKMATSKPVDVAPAENATDVASKLAVEAKKQPIQSATATPQTPPTIDAIEIDGNRNFFAGGGEEGATVRLYVKDKFVADATVEGGRWLVETNEQLLTDPSQRVRVDMLQSGSSAVTARAEVNFDIAPAEPPIVVATAEPETETPAASAAPDPQSAINKAASDNTASQLMSPPKLPVAAPTAEGPVEKEMAKPETVANPETAINATAADNAANQLASPPKLPDGQPAPAAETPMQSAAANPDAPEQAAKDMKPAASDTAPMTENKVVVAQPKAMELAPTKTEEAPTTMVAKPSETVTPEATQAPETKVAAAPKTETKMAEPMTKPSEAAEAKPEAMSPSEQNPEVTKEPMETAKADVPTLVARPAGDGRFVSGQAIIRRGDNLWSIARRVYGQGIRYTTIYQANQSQIRDPHLIYPGQVFDLPKEQQ